MSSIRAASTRARRTAILEAALDCFTTRGVDATTIEELCHQAGCSTGSIYHHFGNKEGIASGLFLHGIRSLNADLLRRLQHCQTAEQSVRMVVIQYCDWIHDNPELARYLLSFRDISFSATARLELQSTYHHHLAAIFRWFRPFVLREEIRTLPPEAYVPIISGPIQDYARHWVRGQFQLPPSAVKDVFAEAAWNAVRGPGAG